MKAITLAAAGLLLAGSAFAQTTPGPAETGDRPAAARPETPPPTTEGPGTSAAGPMQQRSNEQTGAMADRPRMGGGQDDRGARFRLRLGGASLTVRCAPDESTAACMDAAVNLVTRLAPLADDLRRNRGRDDDDRGPRRWDRRGGGMGEQWWRHHGPGRDWMDRGGWRGNRDGEGDGEGRDRDGDGRG